MAAKYRTSKTRLKQKNRRSMRQRIKKMMVFNSLLTIVVMSTLVLMVIYGTIGSMGAMISDVVAGDIVHELEKPYNRTVLSSIKQSGELQESEALQKWYHSIGNKFYFDLSEGFTQRSEDEFDTMVGVMNDNAMEMEFSEEDGLMEISLVFVEITKGDEVVFSTMPEESTSSMDIKKAMKHYEYESVQSYYDVDGAQVGDVRVRFNAMLLVGVTIAFTGLFVIAAILSSIFSIIISIISSGAITKSLGELQRKMRSLAQGELENALHSELEVRRPFSEIEDLASSTRSIIDQMRTYSESIESHRLELEAQNIELVAQGEELTDINGKLESVNVQMKDILDNVGQGFLRFESDLMIHTEYSKECSTLFEFCVANKKLSNLLYPNDAQQAEFVDDLLIKILTSKEESVGLYLPLLPDEVVIHDRIIRIDYKISDAKTAMIVILTDITETRELEGKMDAERQILKMVVKAMVHRSLFVGVVESFEQFIYDGSAAGWRLDGATEDELKFIMRQLHTFKGNFSQFDAINLTRALHNAETKILEALNCGDSCESADIESKILIDLKEAFAKDMDIIRSYVGSEYFVQNDQFVIEKNRILEIEKKMQNVLSEQECKMLLPDIRSLRYKSLKELLKMYPEYSAKLAERLEKSIAPFTIQADDILVDEEKYQGLANVIVHIFRNAIDHGIETPDARVESGKEMVGRISCIVSDLGQAFELNITDDGAGIDLDRIRDKLKENGYSDDAVARLSERELLDTIFEDAFTTHQEATLLSGRGTGLAAVKRAVNELGGKISISSSLGKGTTFTIRIPYDTEHEMRALKAENFLTEVAHTASDYINTHVVNDRNVIAKPIGRTNQIELGAMTALVSLKGVINALILISVNGAFGERLASSFLYDPVPEDEIELYIGDVLAEISNTILGNTLGHFDDGHDFLHMGIPAIISNKGAYVRYSEAEILTCEFEFDDSYMSIHMIRLEGDQIEEATLWQEY